MSYGAIRTSNRYLDLNTDVWAKAGRSRYQRITGEIVEKVGPSRWRSADGYEYLSRLAAMLPIDHQYRTAQ